MTETNTEYAQEPTLDDGEVAAYLQAHPDFLQHHPQVLQALELRHQSGEAASLIERQVSTLREANAQLTTRLNELIETARANEQRVADLNSLARALIAADSPAALVANLETCVQEELHVDALFLGVLGGDEVARGGIHAMREDDAQANSVTNAFRRGKPVCGPLSEEQREALFPELAQSPPRSAALVPLGGASVRGVLVLASRDPRRFVPEMGTLFLDLMAQLVTAACRRQLGADVL